MIIHNSFDATQWPVTSTIVKLEVGNGKFVIDHTKRGQWPAVPFETTTQEATIWVAFNINGEWHATGGERLRPSQSEKELGHPGDIGPGWLYAKDRWGDMANYTPTKGEVIKFMVVAGDTRGYGNVAVQERTEWVDVIFDPAGFSLTSAPTIPPPFEPTPVPEPVVTPEFVALVFATLKDLSAKVTSLTETVQALVDKPAPVPPKVEFPVYEGRILGLSATLTPRK